MYKKRSRNKIRIKYSKNNKTKRVKRKKTKRTKKKRTKKKKHIQKGGKINLIPAITYEVYLDNPKSLYSHLLVYAYIPDPDNPQSEKIVKGIISSFRPGMIHSEIKTERSTDKEHFIDTFTVLKDKIVSIRHADTKFISIPGTNNAFGKWRRRPNAEWQTVFHNLVDIQELPLVFTGAEEWSWDQGSSEMIKRVGGNHCFTDSSPEGICSTWDIFLGHGQNPTQILEWGENIGLKDLLDEEWSRRDSGETAGCSVKAFDCIRGALSDAREKSVSSISTSQGSALFLSSIKDSDILSEDIQISESEAGILGAMRKNVMTNMSESDITEADRGTLWLEYQQDIAETKKRLILERPVRDRSSRVVAKDAPDILKGIRNIVLCSPGLTWGNATSCSEVDLIEILRKCKVLKIPIILIDTEYGDQNLESTRDLWNKHIRQYCDETEGDTSGENGEHGIGSLNLFIRSSNHAMDCAVEGEDRDKIQGIILEIIGIIYKWCKVYDPRLRSIYCKLILQKNSEIELIVGQ